MGRNTMMTGTLMTFSAGMSTLLLAFCFNSMTLRINITLSKETIDEYDHDDKKLRAMRYQSLFLDDRLFLFKKFFLPGSKSGFT